MSKPYLWILISFLAILDIFCVIFICIHLKNEKIICQTEKCLAESLDHSVDPCDDFYQYACGYWPTVTHSRDTFEIISQENDADIKDFLKKNNTEDEPEAVHKARKLYTSCLSEAFYGNKTEPIEVILKQIGLPVHSFLSPEIKDFDIALALAKVARLAGVKPFFDLGIIPNPYNRTVNVIGLSSPDEQFDPDIMPTVRSKIDEEYMSEATIRMCKDNVSAPCLQWISPNNTKRTEICNSTTKLMFKAWLQQLKTLHTPPSKNSSLLAINSSEPIEMYNLKQLQDLSDSIANKVNTTLPKLNWTKYIEEMFTGLDNVTMDLSNASKVPILIIHSGFLKKMLQLIYEIPTVKDIELIIWWNVVSTLLPYADSKVFADSVSTQEERCSAIVTKSFSMAVSYMYATKPRYIEAKIQIGKMFENIRESFAQIIQQSPWLDNTTEQNALKKLNAMGSFIAYPSAIKTTSMLNDFYQNVQMKNNFFDTMVSKIQKQMAKTLNKLNQTNNIEEDVWSIIPPNTVNAVYEMSENRVTIPAGILGRSIYNGSLRALDYGAIGTIIGHEMTHALDSSGRLHNYLGNFEDWWKPETVKLFNEKATCFVEAYGSYSTSFNGITQKGDSKATLHEDISDSGGFRESLYGYRRSVAASGEEPLLPQFASFTHEQLFTLSFANLWCENPNSSKILRELGLFTDHSPNGVRVNGVLKNSKEFSDIWNCPKGSQMNPSEDKCLIW